MRQKHKTQETSLYLYPGCFIQKQPNYELKHRYQLRGMASTYPAKYVCKNSNTHAHIHITPAVEAMDSCFALIGVISMA